MHELTNDQRANVTKWVEALESGDYKQGMGRLRTTDDKFCCLGVAACTLGAKWSGTLGNYYCRESDIERGRSFSTDLGGSMLKELGLDYTIQSRLIQMNDAEFASFAQIAKYIRATILGEVVLNEQPST